MLDNRHTQILHRGSSKAEKIRNFSVMHLHLEKAPKTTQFYNIYSINNALLNTYKIPSIFLGFSCFLFHDEILFLSNLWPRNEYTYIVIFFLNFLNLIYNNQLLIENHTLTSYKWHSDSTIACEKWHYQYFFMKELSCFSTGIFWGEIFCTEKSVASATHCYTPPEQ